MTKAQRRLAAEAKDKGGWFVRSNIEHAQDRTYVSLINSGVLIRETPSGGPSEYCHRDNLTREYHP